MRCRLRSVSVFGVAAGRASPPAACLAEGASEALARGFVPGLLLALSPPAAVIQPLVVFDHHRRRSCYPQPPYPSLARLHPLLIGVTVGATRAGE